MDPYVIFISLILQPIINYVLFTIKNPATMARLVRAEPIIRLTGKSLIQFADAILANPADKSSSLKDLAATAFKAKSLLASSLTAKAEKEG